MPKPAISLDVLPAGYGDCLLVECPVGRRTWRLLVDTGPDETYPLLKARLARIRPNAQGRRRIDLAIVSHIDHDHIGGAALLFADRELGLSFGDVWFNAPPRPRPRGVAEGEGLSALLGAPGVSLPWNRAFDGEAVVTGADGVLAVPTARGAPRLTLLSPDATALAALFKVWDRELAKLRAGRSDRRLPAAPQSRDPSAPDLLSLAARKTADDRAVPNRSSIAVLLEHRGASLLLGADAVPRVLVPALKALAAQRGLPTPLHVDALKLCHHGSRGNATRALFELLQADHYLVSSNGAIFDHPDEEAMARVILGGGARPRLWFNYDNARSRRWTDPALQAQHGFDIELPPTTGPGVTLRLAPRP